MGKNLKILLLIILFHLLLVSRLNFFPYPELFIYPYLTNIGMTPYSEILDQHFPGLMFLPINLGTLGINSPQSMFILHLFIIAITHVLIFFASRKLIGKDTLYANIFYLLWNPYLEGNVLWIDSFIPIFTISSYLALSKSKTKLGGFLLGVGMLLKQIIIPLAGLVFIYYLIKKEFKNAFKFIEWFSIPGILMVLFYLKQGNFSDFFYWTVTYNTTTFSEFGRKYATLVELSKFFIIFSPAFVASGYLFFRKEKDKLIAIFFFTSLLFAYARFDFIHLQPSLPVASILFAYIFSLFPDKLSKNIIFVYVLLVSINLGVYHQALKSREVKFMGDLEYSLSAEVRKYANEGDPIFTLGGIHNIYYLTNTRPSGNVFVFQFPWFMRETESRVLSGLISDPPKVVLRDKSASIDKMSINQYMPQLNDYVEKNYYLVAKIQGIDILIPNESSN